MNIKPDEPKPDFEETNNFWNYSPEYDQMLWEGRMKSPPSIGSPTFVWHIGIWPTQMPGEKKHNASDLTDNGSIKEILQNKYNEYDRDNEKFFREISRFATKLQEMGRVSCAPIEELTFRKPNLSGSRHTNVFPFRVCDPQSLSFTLWWEDEASKNRLNTRQKHPNEGSLRVRVTIQTHIDHATISFYIDAAKRYGGKQLYKPDANIGKRLTAIANHLFTIRDTAEHQVQKGYVDGELVPELGVSDELNERLNEIADYFYEGIWREFSESFDLNIPFSDDDPEKKIHGERFAEFRGVIMNVPGIKTEINEKKAEQRYKIRVGAGAPEEIENNDSRYANTGFGPFATYDWENGEPNTIIKSLWPFIRRTTPYADYKDFVACGIIDWRALYISALGSTGTIPPNEEWPVTSEDFKNGYWPRTADDATTSSAIGDQKFHAETRHKSMGTSSGQGLTDGKPLRYLILSKGEPHREQIGRFVDRINSIGTMRLFSLKSMATIKNAGVYLRILSRTLDGVYSDWGAERNSIDEWYRAEELKHRLSNNNARKTDFLSTFDLNKWLVGDIPENRKPGDPIPVQTLNEIAASGLRASMLSKAIRQTEEKLVVLNAELDEIGQGGSGRLLHVINRSRYYISEFERLWPTLEIGNIDGWINYKQFVIRNLDPTFDYIHATGDQLILIRDRLQNITNTIQTSALIIEAEETRTNTDTLRAIAANIAWNKWRYPIWAIVILTLLDLIANIIDIDDTFKVTETIKSLL